MNSPTLPRGQVSPIRAARAAALAAWLRRAKRICLDKGLYDELRGDEGWTRAAVDRAIDDLAHAGVARLVHQDFILFLELAEGEP